MTPALRPFDPNGFDLDPGIRLLEASAGTGKTYALAHLVLRLVGERGVLLPRLLVVTFTEAAAAELRDRIGRRLQEALAGLERSGEQDERSDPVLRQWLAGQSRQPPGRLRGRMLLALEELDGADITTIHGFCRRTLQRQALEAGRPPELRLETGGEALLDQVVHDLWQRQLLPLPAHLLDGIVSRGVTPALLKQLLRQLDGDPALSLAPLPAGMAPEQPLAEVLLPWWQERWQHFQNDWPQRGRALQADLQEAARQWKASEAGDSKPYAASARRDRCGELDLWLAGQDARGDAGAAARQELLRTYYHPGAFTQVAQRLEGLERPIRLPQETLMRTIADLVDGPAERALLHACHWCRCELQRRRRQAGVSSFAQLLEDLDPGATASEPTPLLEAVGQRYDAALVDEFQDTDPIQWRILRLAFGRGAHPLVIVGDPKQAIYRFRGGDLDTYRAARAAAIEVHDLQENRRSTAALVTALNGLMAGGMLRSDLKVPPVQPRARRAGPDGPPVTLLWLAGAGDQIPTRSELEQALPGSIASLVLELLEQGLELQEDDSTRLLQPSDICLLVSSHRQAESLRSALEQRGVASRLVSRADVFASPAATALQRLLDALADPADANRQRLLAASPLLGWSATQIADLDPGRWSTLAAELAGLAGRLSSRGLLGVLADLINEAAMARLAASGRMLADLQQVAELVQQRVHREQLGPEAAADWLRRLRLEPDREPPEEHQAHSDRSDDAVSVVTIHRSKGLEFPVVICPTLWQAASSQSSTGLRWLPPGAAAPQLDLHLDRRWGAGAEAARQNRAAEDAERERLAYVAMTRARHRLVLAWGPARNQQSSPLQPWLLPSCDPDEARTPAAWREALEQSLQERGLEIALRDAPAAGSSRLHAPAPSQSLSNGPVPQRPFERGWGRSSYSSWTAGSHPPLDPTSLEEGRDTADADLQPEMESALRPGIASEPASGSEADDSCWSDQGPLGGFARGAAAGDCLHRILERLALDAPLASAA
ncbi:MAG: UvrD-helicase domain-containing protein, partial [Synechococcaceae cyanobacterium]|nr:UvrD-helicase domain-containing protein [Synechococcaceae cyanobacterium]